MATPQEIYNSDVYQQAAEEMEPVPSAWFVDVYEALGDVLTASDQANTALIAAAFDLLAACQMLEGTWQRKSNGKD